MYKGSIITVVLETYHAYDEGILLPSVDWLCGVCPKVLGLLWLALLACDRRLPAIHEA